MTVQSYDRISTSRPIKNRYFKAIMHLQQLSCDHMSGGSGLQLGWEFCEHMIIIHNIFLLVSGIVAHTNQWAYLTTVAFI